MLLKIEILSIYLFAEKSSYSNSFLITAYLYSKKL